MIGCAVELIAGGLGGVCVAAVATWYLLDRRSKRKTTDPTTDPTP